MTINVSTEGCDLAYSRAVSTLRILPAADLPLVKPDCALCMREGIISPNLVATIFDNILESTFNKDMGRNEPGSSGSFPFFAMSFMLAR